MTLYKRIEWAVGDPAEVLHRIENSHHGKWKQRWVNLVRWLTRNPNYRLSTSEWYERLARDGAAEIQIKIDEYVLQDYSTFTKEPDE